MEERLKVSIDLAWKEHRIDLRALEAWLRENAGEHYRGNCTDDNKLMLAFVDEPGEEVREAIADLWEELEDEEHEMCESYVSSADLEVDRQEKRDSARAKLEALGLTADELKAILG